MVALLTLGYCVACSVARSGSAWSCGRCGGRTLLSVCLNLLDLLVFLDRASLDLSEDLSEDLLGESE